MSVNIDIDKYQDFRFTYFFVLIAITYCISYYIHNLEAVIVI